MARFLMSLVVLVGFVAVGAAEPPAHYREYQVRAGDTLFKIAERELGSGERWREIRKADGFVTADDAPRLQVGMPLYLPVAEGSGKPPSTEDPPSGPDAIFSREAFDRAFPASSRHKIYSYDAFLQAAAMFPRFCGEGTAEQRKRELAAFLANVAHETGSLKYAEEINKGDYRQPNAQWPPQPGKKYFGRGPLQLSWNYNYGMAGAALGLDLLGDPDLVARDGVVAFKTALWFWMTAQSPRPSCHEVMTDRWKPTADDVRAARLPGFGMTIVLINSMEAGKPNDERVKSRVRNFEKFARDLGVTVGDNVSCESMKPYGRR